MKHIIKTKYRLNRLLLLLSAVLLVSCNEYKEVEERGQFVDHEINLQLPIDIQNAQITEARVVMTNVSSRQEYAVTAFHSEQDKYVANITLPEGTYNLMVNGVINYQLNKKEIKAKVKAKRDNVVIQATSKATNIGLNVFAAEEGFVITELFFTGTTTPQGFMYTDDQYIKIGNNSDTIMYADGLCFVESFFTSDDKHDYQPDIMSQAITIDAIYMVPGTGKEHPVKPGEELTIALTAIDHRPINPNSFDLSSADFEIYDKTSNPEGDQDNPKVTNLLNWYANFEGTFVMHTRGVKSYALVRPMVDMATFMKDYRYKFGYTFKQGEYVIPMDENEYFIPNSWVVDAVNLAVPTVHEWNIISPILDKGFTYCGHVDADEQRYNKAVVRLKEDKKWIDTNNSTHDFQPNAVPTYLKNK